MKQVKSFNQSKGGKVPNFCLRNVRLGFAIPALYDDAWTAWKNTEQHKNRTIPKLDVPLYYSYTATIGGVRKNYGHINVRLKDGRIWNDGKIFASLSAFEKAWSNVKYVGWGESINKVKVIEDDMYKDQTAKYWHDWGQTKNKYFLARKKQAIEQQAKIAELDKALVIKDKEIDRLNSLVGDSTKWNTLKTLLKELLK